VAGAARPPSLLARAICRATKSTHARNTAAEGSRERRITNLNHSAEGCHSYFPELAVKVVDLVELKTDHVPTTEEGFRSIVGP